MTKCTLLDADGFSRDREYTAIDEPPSHSLSRVIKELIGRVLLSGKMYQYFRKVAGDDNFKIRGIEARQRSTLPFIEDV